MRRSLAGLFALAVPSAIAAQNREVAPRAVLGCYDVDEGAWEPDQSREYLIPQGPPASGDSTHYQIPPRIELTGAPQARASRGGWAIETPEGALPTSQRFKFWGMAGDSLRIGLTDGFVGIGGTLGASGDDWTGSIRTVSDVGGSQPSFRGVRLTRVPCASPPPVSDDVVPYVVRSVELVGDMVIALGEPLPSALTTTPRRSGALLVSGRTTGLFPPTDSVAVMVDAFTGLVGGIELKWVPPQPVRPFLAPLEAAMPAATPTYGGTVLWESRTTRLSVFLREDGVGRLRMTDPRFGRE